MDLKGENNSPNELIDGAIIIEDEKNIIDNSNSNINNNNSNNTNISPISTKIKNSSSNLLDKESTHRLYHHSGDYSSSGNQGELEHNDSEYSSLNKKSIISPHFTSSNNNINNNTNNINNKNENDNNNNNNSSNNNNNNNNLESSGVINISSSSGSSSSGGDRNSGVENNLNNCINNNEENNNNNNEINNNNNDYMNNVNNYIKENNNSNIITQHSKNNILELDSQLDKAKKIHKKKKKKTKNFEVFSVNKNSENNILDSKHYKPEQQQASENSFSNSTIINQNKKNKIINGSESIDNSNNNSYSNNSKSDTFIPFTNNNIKMELSDPLSDQSNNSNNNSETFENCSNNDSNINNTATSTSLENSTQNSLENSPKLKPQTTTTTTTTTTTSPDNNNNNDNDNDSNINNNNENTSTKSESNLKVEYRNETEYDRKEFYQYRDDHRENGEIGVATIKSEEDLNKKYDDFNEGKRLKSLSYWLYFKFLFNKNKYKWDINKNKKFYLAAQIITRFGFFSKTILYCSLGVLSIAAAVDKERAVQGPDGVFEELQEMFSGGVIFLLLLGLWSYGCWGIFYVVFDVDQLGHKGAGPILKRFGRIFSSGFYFVLGVDAARVLAHNRKQQSGTSHILGFLYKYIFGKIIVCVLGVTFFVVAIVYLLYFIKPDKFKRELSTERMNKYLYWAALGFARIGAVGRSMFFGAFGGVLIKAVADINKGKEGDTSLLGFQGVFQQIANYNTTLLFIIAILIMFYALWCFWLMFFRRLPAHQDAKYAREVLGSAIDKKYVFNGILFRILRNYEDGENDADVNDLSEFHEHHPNDAMSPSIPYNNQDDDNSKPADNTYNYYVDNQKSIPSNVDKTYNI